jgi:hypothetical protein
MWYFANGCIRLSLPWEPCSQEWIRGISGWGSLIRGWLRIARQTLFALNRCAERAYVPSVRGQWLILDTCRSGRSFDTKTPALSRIGCWLVPSVLLGPFCNGARAVEFSRGGHMDRGDGPSLLPVEGGTPREQCSLCATARRAAELRTGRGAEYVDDDVVVISGAELEGLVVVPRLHVGGLEELSITSRANVLAAVQRAAVSVKEKSPWSTASVLALTDLPASQGHVCIQVLPGGADNPGDSISPSSA